MANTISGAFALATLSLLCACATPSSGTVYSRNEARTAWSVVEGRVNDIKPVQIEGNKSVLGTAGGGYVGYELGRTMGSGRGRDLAGAVGAVAGAATGQVVEERATRQNALQITIDLDRGETIAVVQAADVAFAPGERVKVLRRGDGAARVAKCRCRIVGAGLNIRSYCARQVRIADLPYSITANVQPGTYGGVRPFE